MMRATVLSYGLALAAIAGAASVDGGRQSFEKRCGGCHGLDTAKEGPALRGVIGRRAGKQANFEYSEALRTATFSWDVQRLDQWLSDPDSVVPGTDMAFRLSDKAERDRIIGYLQQLK